MEISWLSRFSSAKGILQLSAQLLVARVSGLRGHASSLSACQAIFSSLRKLSSACLGLDTYQSQMSVQLVLISFQSTPVPS